MPRYRSWAERRDIICALIAATNPPPIASFDLTASEEIYFRARSARAVAALARETSSFRDYYALPTARPFVYVLGISAIIVIFCALVALNLWLTTPDLKQSYPLLVACATLAVAAIGWTVAGGITHRNTIRQNTNNILFTRFTQAPFSESLFRFHKAFGDDLRARITISMIDTLKAQGDDDNRKAAASVTYLLNYYELLASGVLRERSISMVRGNAF